MFRPLHCRSAALPASSCFAARLGVCRQSSWISTRLVFVFQASVAFCIWMGSGSPQASLAHCGVHGWRRCSASVACCQCDFRPGGNHGVLRRAQQPFGHHRARASCPAYGFARGVEPLLVRSGVLVVEHVAPLEVGDVDRGHVGHDGAAARCDPVAQRVGAEPGRPQQQVLRSSVVGQQHWLLRCGAGSVYGGSRVLCFSRAFDVGLAVFGRRVFGDRLAQAVPLVADFPC